MNALFTGGVSAIAQKMVVLLLLMEKRFEVPIIKAVGAGNTCYQCVFGNWWCRSWSTKNSRKKSNEITAIPELINLLDIKGKIITTDGMGCQKDISEKIFSLEGDYLFAVK